MPLTHPYFEEEAIFQHFVALGDPVLMKLDEIGTPVCHHCCTDVVIQSSIGKVHMVQELCEEARILTLRDGHIIMLLVG